jgi:hypothetical protein
MLEFEKLHSSGRSPVKPQVIGTPGRVECAPVFAHTRMRGIGSKRKMPEIHEEKGRFNLSLGLKTDRRFETRTNQKYKKKENSSY